MAVRSRAAASEDLRPPSPEKAGGLTLSVLRNTCGVFESKVVQVTEGLVKEDGDLAFVESNVCCCLFHICVGN